MPRPPSDAADRILDALADLLDAGASPSMSQVAAAAGVSKGGLLHHYGTRRALLTALVEREVTRVEDRISARHARGGTFAEAYLAVVLEDAQARVGVRMLRSASADPAVLEPLRNAYTRWHVALEADALPEGRATVVRLAIDGLWLGALFEMPPPGELAAALTLLAHLSRGS